MEGKPFLLRPDIPEEGMARTPRPGESADLLSEPLRSYAAQAGLEIHRPSITPYSVYALEATEYAKERHKFDSFHRGLYKSYWENGHNLGDLDVIKEVSESCGLNWSELGARLKSGHYRGMVERQFNEAVKIGITGIPAFLIGDILLTGARPYQMFRSVMDRIIGKES